MDKQKLLDATRVFLLLFLKATVILFAVAFWVLFCFAVISSNTAAQTVSLFSLVLGLFNFFFTVALWVLYLGKLFSTHTIQMIDPRSVIPKKDPLDKPAPVRDAFAGGLDSLADDEEEADALDRFADNVVNEILRDTRPRSVKEKLTDNFT